MATPKSVAIVCDWLVGLGGAERVVVELHKLFPDAPIYTSQYAPVKISWLKDADVRTSYLQKLPSGLKKFLPLLRASYFSKLKLDDYDLVISASGAEAKFIKSKSTHVAYVHAPTHYYWSRYEQYLKHPGFGGFDWLARIGLKIFAGPMRRWDYRAAQRPAYLIANSTYTQKAIKKYYNRDSVVIHPPVDVERFSKHAKPRVERRGFVIIGRQTPYKRVDLAVSACTKLNLPLTVIGDGPQQPKLVELAGNSIRFLGEDTDDQEVAEIVGASKGFIFPGLDDFGIVAVEALAAGTPVIAYQGGGALDYIEPGKNGLFFDEQTVDSLARTLQKFNPDEFSYVPSIRFSEAEFRQKISDFVSSIDQK